MASPQSTTLPIVAIAGATGHLGKHVASAFLTSNLRNRFSEIILLSRQGSHHNTPPTDLPSDSPKLTIRTYTEDSIPSITRALQGATILINTIGPSGHSFKEKLLHAIPHSSIQVYFPSEFGVNHYVHDFPHREWDAKKKHMALAEQLLLLTQGPSPKKVKICRVFCGLFLEDSIGPWFGFDTKRGRYECVGSSSDVKVSFTSLGDVGRCVAALASLGKDEVPETVHVAGDSRSVREIAEVMGEFDGGEIEVVEIGLEGYKREVLEGMKESWDPAPFLRFLMGEGKIMHTARDCGGGLGNDRELVNPGERLWKWETLRDLARREGGRPWGNYVWPPVK
ncbi:hypothetical protein ASPTUDRAFT_41648 [Aspergillus tubingensis CBS 134.48]|uniref:NmrA-like domain-containing protein n=1 Tax=Aspergillus tubingensis (strain CBS 134.48) TaxID=767770 RepID=A0A1L9N7W3_ASPTC|nr:hypothetical protein ASPTUDRAFT_41648 [Aspergillus tubingensis CBS 134.48]